MNEVLKKIQNIGIVPVIKLEDAKDAVPLAKALCEGGIPCAEITFRTSAAAESIRLMSEAFPEMLIGAGTVLTTEQVDLAVESGATFIVSPGLNPKIVSYCVEKGIPITPGCSNPSDIEQAIELGLDVVKFFPAEAAGGLPMIKAMSAPYTSVKFMPTGGINASNLTSYLDFSKIIACGGSWMVNDELVRSGNFDQIRELTREAVKQMLGYKLSSIGIYGGNEEKAKSIAKIFENLFGFEVNLGEDSIFAGKEIEIMKEDSGKGYGHVTIQTNYIDRAIYHLGSQGFTFIEDSKQYDGKGNLNLISLDIELGGFTVKLAQK